MKINGKITEIITSRAFVSFGGFVELVGSSAYFVNTEWKRKADLEIAYNNGYSDAEYKI